MQGIEKALGDKRIRAVFGGESESGLEYFRWNLRLFLLFLAFFLFVSSAWAECGRWVSFSYNNCPVDQLNCSYTFSEYYLGNGAIVGDVSASPVSGNVSGLQFTYTFTGKYSFSTSYVGGYASSLECDFYRGNMRYGGSCKLYFCDNQNEADSVACVNDGGIWATNSQGNKYCAKSYCTSEDTLNLNREKEHCDSLGAENNFALTNTEGCPLSGICNLCSGNAYRNYVQSLKERCCDLGKVPDTVKCVMKDLTSTQNNYAQLQGDGCLSTGEGSVIITPNGESVIEGCEPSPNSSNSSPNSSSSEQSSSSECIGLDCPSSDSNNDISGQLEDIKDSLHKIIIYDSTTASNSVDLVNYLYDIKTCLEAGTCGNGNPIDYSDSLHAIKDTLHRSNEYLKQIADKDLSVQVNGGLTAEKQAELVNNIQYVADSAAKYGNVNGEKLDSIVSALKGIGMDSVAHKLDSMRNDKLDTISGGIYSLDSTFAYWGDSSNWKMDSAGWGGKYDSLKDWGDSLTGAMGDWLEGCDTTGGKHCDNIYIGSHGLDSATSGMKGAAGALRDSMLNGRFADSLNLWASKFNNEKLTGSGSNTCPSALTRSYTLNFGSMGEVQMGSFGTYLCEPIFGSVTPWTLGRILLRAIVAISCMWFLFKCATGFKGDSGEED